MTTRHTQVYHFLLQASTYVLIVRVSCSPFVTYRERVKRIKSQLNAMASSLPLFPFPNKHHASCLTLISLQGINSSL